MTIRRSGEDFLVDEVLTAAVLGSIQPRPRRHALYRLTKAHLATPQAASAVAKALGVPPSAVAYAGLKDKHARTVQHVSVRLTRPMPGGGPSRAEGRGWRIERLGWLDEPLTSAAIAANHFRIVVRGLTEETSADMDEAIGLLTPPARCEAAREGEAASAGEAASGGGRVRFVNYFGRQRFGSARHGRGFAARHLIRGEFEQALKLALAAEARKDHRSVKRFKRAVAAGWGQWQRLAERLPRCPDRRAIEVLAAGGGFREAFVALPYLFQQLCVEAYQSLLWNAVARGLIEQRCAEPGPILLAEDAFGAMLFPAAGTIPPDLADLEMPLLGPKTPLAEPWRAAAEEVLKEEGITTADLRIPHLHRPYFGEAPRRLFVDASGFSVSLPQPDETAAGPRRLKRSMEFHLPRGAYATVLLRALQQ